ncbi:hypothetical protein BH23PAT2_BH23PAT2_01180 [soil metagenome]
MIGRKPEEGLEPDCITPESPLGLEGDKRVKRLAESLIIAANADDDYSDPEYTVTDAINDAKLVLAHQEGTLVVTERIFGRQVSIAPDETEVQSETQ